MYMNKLGGEMVKELEKLDLHNETNEITTRDPRSPPKIVST